MEAFFSQIIRENNLSLEESQVFKQSEEGFWHSSVLDHRHLPISGGFGFSRVQARKIALAEYLERTKYDEIFRSDTATRESWGINLIPTACGFAAGFEKENVILRSILEATERWVMSNWIDNLRIIDEVPFAEMESILDDASRFFVSNFEQVKFFRKFILVNAGDRLMGVTVCFSMGLTNNGIFPGSSAGLSSQENWQHALLESFRHQLIVRNTTNARALFPTNKIRYFAERKELGLNAIASATISEWGNPKLIFHRVQSFLDGKYFVARTIVDGWKSWHLGPVDRFLY